MNVPKNFQDVVDRLQNYNPNHGIADCPCTGHNTPEKTLSVNVTLRNRVRECRLRALIVSQAELARLTGLCRTTICALENNRIPLSIAHAILIKRATGCSLDDLYEEIASEAIQAERVKSN